MTEWAARADSSPFVWVGYQTNSLKDKEKLVPRRGLESAHKRLILNDTFIARPNLPTRYPLWKRPLDGQVPSTLQWSKFPVLRRLNLVDCGSPRR